MVDGPFIEPKLKTGNLGLFSEVDPPLDVNKSGSAFFFAGTVETEVVLLNNAFLVSPVDGTGAPNLKTGPEVSLLVYALAMKLKDGFPSFSSAGAVD